MQGRFTTSLERENPTIFKKLIFQKFLHAIYLKSSPWQLKPFFVCFAHLIFYFFISDVWKFRPIAVSPLTTFKTKSPDTITSTLSFCGKHPQLTVCLNVWLNLNTFILRQ